MPAVRIYKKNDMVGEKKAIINFFEALRDAHVLDTDLTDTRSDDAVTGDIDNALSKAVLTTQKTWQQTSNNPVAVVSALALRFSGAMPRKIKILKENTELSKDMGFNIGKKQFSVRLIKEKAAYTPDIAGVWGLNPTSLKEVD